MSHLNPLCRLPFLFHVILINFIRRWRLQRLSCWKDLASMCFTLRTKLVAASPWRMPGSKTQQKKAQNYSLKTLMNVITSFLRQEVVFFM